MKYKGVVFVLGVDLPESMKNMDKIWKAYFDDISIEKPRDDIDSFTTRRRGDVDIRPLVGKRGEDYVLICPTTPSVLEKWGDNEIHGTVRQRAPLYMPDTDIVIGLGKCGSYLSTLDYGKVLLPKYVENSENLMHKGNLEVKGGYSDEGIQKKMRESINRWVKPSYAIRMISLADIEEVIEQSENDKMKMGKDFVGSDMETGWFLGYSNKVDKKAGSALIVADLPGDRPFEDYKTKMDGQSIRKRIEDNWKWAMYGTIECVLGY